MSRDSRWHLAPTLFCLLTGCVSVLDERVEQVPAEPEPTVARWPSFRGPSASGVADGQSLPEIWEVGSGAGIRWKTPIPGLAHSSPVVWGDRIYVTSAVSGAGEADFKHGLYGSGDASTDRSVHRFVVLALDAASGDVVWESVAHTGAPKDKRHVKATYANSSPATDGEHVVTLFGSEGLFAFDASGRKLWHRDLGRLDVGAYDVPSYEWGSASSPILWRGRVFVQCDSQGEDFVLAVDVETGETLWRTARDELPSWGTPTIYTGPGGPVLVTNGSNYIRGYDPMTGEELWKIAGSSKITAPTPIWDGERIVVASGRRPEKPIFALRPDGEVIWSNTGRGPYMPTPLIYDGLLYVLNNNGVLDCYDLATGEEIYRERLPHVGGGFSASPVAADGKLYLPAEDGQIFVVRAGSQFELLATNELGERIMASPALGRASLLVRAERHLFAIGD